MRDISLELETTVKGNTRQIFSTPQSISIAVLLLMAYFLLPACATLDPNYEEPTVMLSSFRAIPSEGIVPAFEVGLRIINPNDSPLELAGVVYSISLQGHELVKGVGKGYPPIEGYSEGIIKLTAGANLLEGIRFITGMAKNQDAPVEYRFQAKLDLAGIYPSLRISETGLLDLGGRE